MWRVRALPALAVMLAILLCWGVSSVAYAQDPFTWNEWEQLLFRLINEERARSNLPQLELDPALGLVSRTYAQEMIDGRFFGHINPTTKSTPGGRLREAGVDFYKNGENLAGNSDIARAFSALMESETHKANILGDGFTKVGIGVIHGGPYGYMIVQEFVGPRGEKVVAPVEPPVTPAADPSPPVVPLRPGAPIGAILDNPPPLLNIPDSYFPPNTLKLKQALGGAPEDFGDPPLRRPVQAKPRATGHLDP